MNKKSMEDVILKKFFENERWEYALNKGIDKHISKAELYQLTKPERRIEIYRAMKNGTYTIAPPHTALIPKDKPGEFRTVYICEPMDRVVLSIANDLLFELMPEMVHKNCKSYQKGIGCGRVVQQISKEICMSNSGCDFKADLSKYFDSVDRKYIHLAFDKVEARWGHSALIDVLRKFYDCDYYFDTDGNLQQSYQSLKQGVAVASWLADVVLYDMDERCSKLNVVYKRYSDDIIGIGCDAKECMQIMKEELGKRGLKLNPKKVEFLDKKHWFKFLGYSIKGSQISLSETRIKKFRDEIRKLTIKDADWNDKPEVRLKRAINKVLRYLYYGNGEYSWATQVLSVMNVKYDVLNMNEYVVNSLRAVYTGKHSIGGIGYNKVGKCGCVVYQMTKVPRDGEPKNDCNGNMRALPYIEGYYTLSCMQNLMKTRKDAYESMVRMII